MSSAIGETISRQEKKDLAKLGPRRRFSAFGVVMFSFIMIVSGFVVFSAITRKAPAIGDTPTQIWTEEYKSQQAYYSDWIGDVLGSGSRILFERLSNLLYASATTIVSENVERSSLQMFSNVIVTLHLGLMRAGFILIAWWRIWLIAIVGSAIWGALSWVPYRGKDFLGTRTNGKLFYSGIRAGLEKVAPNGIPDVQVTGLACPAAVSETEAKYSSVGKVLEKFGVANKTNISLAGIIAYYKSVPAYVAKRTEQSLLSKIFVGSALPDNTAALLQALLELQFSYRKSLPEQEPPAVAPCKLVPDTFFDSKGYARALTVACDRVLTPQMKRDLISVSAHEIATIILAIEASKVMAFGKEGDRWVRKSNFPQLCARSILHSISEYAEEFAWNQRDTIRRSIIYGSRKSVYGPVKFAVDLSDGCRAARQWVEVLMASPHELEAVTDDVELFGLVCQSHQAWSTALMDAIMMGNQQFLGACYATQQLFFAPLGRVLQLFRAVVKPEIVARMRHLVAAVSARQRLVGVGASSTSEEIQPGVPPYERIFAPLSAEEISKISKDHQLSPTDVEEWCTLRIVPNAFGWLGRRVGDHTVPESSVVFLNGRRSRFAEGSERGNDTASLNGMIVFRAGRLQDRWHAAWSNRFEPLEGVVMAQSREDFEKIQRGIDPSAVPNESMAVEGI